MKSTTTQPALPVVYFEYPDSASNLLRPRHVQVTKMNELFIEGYELAHPKATDNSPKKFKRFNLSRIVKNGVSLVHFGS